MSPKKNQSKKSKKDDEGRQIIARNRRAGHDYILTAKIEVGLVLLGSEVKSLRTNGATIRDGYAKIERGELWLFSVHIPTLQQASQMNHEPARTRKCLVHRRELRKIEAELDGKGTTLIPVSLYFKGVRAKMELAVARGRQKGDKRQREREKDDWKRMREAM